MRHLGLVVRIWLCALLGAGALQAQEAVPDFRYLVSRDTDFHGTDLDALFDTDLESCTRACSANAGCEGFTFNSRSRACFPKTSIDRRSDFAGAVSAMRVATEPQVLQQQERRRGTLDFLRAEDFTRAAELARDLGFRHPAAGHDLDQALASRRSEESAGAHASALEWAGIAVSLSDRSDLWADYSRLSLLRAEDADRPRPLRERALSAAVSAYMRAEGDGARASALVQMAKALESLDRGAVMIPALRLANDLQPRAETGDALEAAIGKYGFRVSDTVVESDSAEPRICAEFSEPLRTSGVDYENFARLPESGLTVTSEDSRLCVEGVEHGKRYRVTLRRGLPAASGEELVKDVEIALYVRDRAPAVRFPGRAYILPKAADAALPVETVNASTLDLTLRRISDRNLLRSMQEQLFARPLSYWQEQTFDENIAEEVWSGTAEVMQELNEDMTTRLPLGDMIGDQPPGIYALTARIPGADPYDKPGATQWFVLSDIGISTMSGTDGLHVTLRSLADAGPIAGAEVSLVSRANAVLARAVSDAEGRVTFDPGLVRGLEGAAPALVLAERGGDQDAKQGGHDFAFLSLLDPAFDLSDRGVSGLPPAGPIDLFLTTDRGAYRAGESVHATVLARDDKAAALDDLTLTAVLKRPDGVEYAREVSQGGYAGGHVFGFDTGADVPRGTWRLDIYSDPEAPALASQPLLVEDFLPERIDFDLELPDEGLRLGEVAMLGIEARYLFGAPGADLEIEGEVNLAAAENLEGWPGYSFGREDARGSTTRREFGGEQTDATGHATIPLDLPEPDVTGQPLEARIVARLSDGSARPVERDLTVPVRSESPLIGIRPLFEDVVPEGGTAAFQVIALDPDLAPEATDLRWTLNRIETRYQWYELYGDWNWEPITRRNRVATGTIESGTAPVRLENGVDWGEYELVIERADGAYAETSLRFHAGWYAGGDSTATPDRLEMSLDRPSYSPGDTARLRINAHLDGEAEIAVLSNHVIDRRAVTLEEGETVIPLEVTEDWGTDAYVSATLIRPMDVQEGRNPARAVGLAHAQIEPGDRRLEVAIKAPDSVRPRQTQAIDLEIAGAAEGEEVWLTLAAVDLGILNLTGFEPPDPEGHYFGQHRLGVELRDVYGRLIDGMNGALGIIRSGGDAGAGLRRQSPPPTQKLLAQFSGPVSVDENGQASVDIDLPDFNGTVRLMAVAWSKRAVGQASRDMTVRDPVVVAVSTPNFLAPGDESRVRLDVTHADGPAGAVSIALEPRGEGITFGDTPGEFTLADGEKRSFSVPVQAGAPGDPGFDVVLTGPDGETLRQSFTLPVRANDPVVARTQRITLDAGGTFDFTGDVFAGLRPGGAQAMISAGALAKFDVPGLLSMLDRYPYGCTEQLASQAMPLLYLSSVAQEMGLGSQSALAAQVDRAIARVLTRQAPNGAFGLWSAESGDFWLDAYVADFLSRARAKGHDVPDRAFSMAMDNLRNQVNYAPDFDEGGEALAYGLLVLAREGAAAMGDLRYYADVKGDAFSTPLAAAQLGAALAAYGDQTRADAMFARAGRMIEARREDTALWRADYGTDLRDSAGVLTLLTEAGSQAVDREDLVTRIAASDRPRSTQEAAWSLLAAQSLVRQSEDSGLRLDGEPVSGPFVQLLAGDTPGAGHRITAAGGRAVELTLTTMGVPETPPAPGGTGYAIERQFYSLDGDPIEMDELSVGTRFVTLLKVTPFENTGARLVIDDPLPAGVEIDNPNLLRSGDMSAFDWIDPSDAEHAEFRSDRFVASVLNSGGNEVRLAYIARAVSPGRFHHPAPSVEDMYRPAFRARGETGSLAITE
ncbi:alpha-2-macroglobulin family protein [Pontibaca methylaminivorans]|uniref:Apple domain-containing protein n=1 Tax=Pontibaca methylaminivorans TaxID=515897 RepID=A0A1R3WSM0_9RHOB|nr:alpha-2-macroglobulin family protein [Pontibaca methylaminivorans]SIT81373.1 hypothetical protein SAMN05421849_1469 [Pontibaca methylaminivorans]